jgi:hypothetical protein
MTVTTQPFSARRARVFSSIAVMLVAAGVALANLSSDLLSLASVLDLVNNRKSMERGYGWPFVWHWRAYAPQPYQVPSTDAYGNGPFAFWHHMEAPWPSRWDLSHFSAFRLTADLLLWFIMLGLTWGACGRALRRYRPLLLGHPRAATVLVLAITSGLILLANLSMDASPERGSAREYSYGWPIIWCRLFEYTTMTGSGRVWDYSAARLASDMTLCLMILVVTGAICQWLLTRNRLPLRWSLQTMLVAMAAIATFCAWFAAARNRANRQDALAERLGDRFVYFDRWGPQWFDLLGADHLRRRMLGAMVEVRDTQDNAENNTELFEHLTECGSLRFLDIQPYLYHGRPFRPSATATTFAAIRQVQVLNIDFTRDDPDESRYMTQEWLPALGRLTQLERLRVRMWQEGVDSLGYLATLTNLKTLTLDVCPSEDAKDVDRHRQRLAIAQLPVLPSLVELNIDVEITDEDLPRLVRFRRLRSLDLSGTAVTGSGLAQLTALESLEELAIDGSMVTASLFESLGEFKRLRTLHIAAWPYHKLVTWPSDEYGDRLTPVVLDDGQTIGVFSSDPDHLHRALDILRQSQRRMVIDGYDQFRERRNLEPPWLDSSRSLRSFARRWLAGR